MLPPHLAARRVRVPSRRQDGVGMFTMSRPTTVSVVVCHCCVSSETAGSAARSEPRVITSGQCTGDCGNPDGPDRSMTVAGLIGRRTRPRHRVPKRFAGMFFHTTDGATSIAAPGCASSWPRHPLLRILAVAPIEQCHAARGPYHSSRIAALPVLHDMRQQHHAHGNCTGFVIGQATSDRSGNCCKRRPSIAPITIAAPVRAETSERGVPFRG